VIRALLAVLLLSAFTKTGGSSLQDAGKVELEFVSGDHWAIDRKQSAKALLLEDGTQWLVINTDAPDDELEQRILHEMAHFIAWQRHGTDIRPHGPEFKRICRQIVTKRQNYFCKGN